jgi:hypothetical protein
LLLTFSTPTISQRSQRFYHITDIITKSLFHMKNLLCLIVVFLSISLNAQLEKIGAYAGTSLIVNNYRSQENAKVNGSAFFSLRQRFGGMASFYGDYRFSYEVGLIADMHKKPEGERTSFKYDDGLNFNLANHKYVNIGVPLSISMRTNSSRNCVTYFKLSLINLFTVYDNQLVANTNIPDRLSLIPPSINSTTSGLKYFSTDIDFGFGTFWYIKKLGAKLCLEPKVTVAQYRGGIQANHLPERQIFNPEFSILTSMGIEVTIYKDMF